MHNHIFLVSMCFPGLLMHCVLPGPYVCSPKFYSFLRLIHVEFTDFSVKRDATLCCLSDTDAFLSSVSSLSTICYCESFSGAPPLPSCYVRLRSHCKESIHGVSISCIQYTLCTGYRADKIADAAPALIVKETKQASKCLTIILY